MQDTEKPLARRAYAKINLGLDVVRRLENGYHEVRMVMQTVGISDLLTFAEAESGIRITTDCGELPVDENNLIYKAARLLAETCGITKGVSIHLEKHIPIAAGMAGGSSDAAAAFHGLNRLFSLGMDLEEMKRLGVRIGADVPYCIVGGTMRSEGIGEILTPLPEAPEAYLVIAKPDISVSTKYVYENLHVETVAHHPDIAAVEAGIRAGDLDGMCLPMENILETVTEKKYPVIARIKELLRDSGAVTALMSGSGPTVFGIFRTRRDAQAAYERMEKSGLAKQLFITTFSNVTCIE